MAKKENIDRSKLLSAMGLSQADFDALDANGKKAIDNLIKQFDKLKDASGEIKSVWDDLTNTIAGVKLNDFYSQIEYSSADIAQMVSDMHRLNDGIKDAASTLNSQWASAISGRQAQLEGMINNTADLSIEMAAALKKAVSSGNIGEFLQEQGAIGEDALQKLIASAGWKSLNKFVTSDGYRGYQDMSKELVRINQLYDLQGKKVVDIGRGVDKILANMTAAFKPEKWVGAMSDFDKIIHETQKNSGIMLADSTSNEQQFTKLTTEAARFGLSVQDSANMMMRLGEGLRTTNLDVLHGAAMDMAAISSATGLSIDEVGELTSQMMFFGKTSKQVSKFSEDTMKSAYKYGVNGKKIMQDITKALPKTRELGWVGGADALKAMALQAERLGQNLDELVESSKKLRTLEGSLEASADLALMGLNIDPLQMLGAARKGGKEYSDMIAQLGQGIGTFNEKTGEMDFNPLDSEILKGRAEAVGISVETLQKQLTKAAQDNQKIDLMPPGLFSGLDDEEKAFLLSQMEMKDGKLVNFKIGNITDLSKLTKGNIDAAAKDALDNKMTLEQQAENNMHFQQSVEAFKGSIMSMFTYLQPIIDWATGIIQDITKVFGSFTTEGKIFVAGLLGALALWFGAGKQVLAGYFFGQGFNRATQGGGFLSALKGMLNPFKGATPPPATVAAGGAGGTLPGGIPTGNEEEEVEQAAGVSKLSEALRAMPSPQQLLALSAALVAFGFAILEIGYGIKVAAEGLSSLVMAFDGISNAGAALGAVAVVMAGFIGIIWAMVPAIAALSTVGTMGALGLLALGAAFLGIGAGIYLASTGLASLVAQFSLLGNSISGTVAAMLTGAAVVGGFVAIMYMMVPAITALGVAGTAGAVGLAALAVAFLGIGAGIYLASSGLTKIVESFVLLSNTLAPIKGAFATTAVVMAGFVGMMAIMVPVIGALAAISTVGAVGLVALGLAFMGIGQGITLASNGIVKIIQSFETLSGSSEAIKGAVYGVGISLAGFALSILAVVPAIYALGVAGTSGAVGLAVLAVAFLGIGKGISLASEGLASLVSSFKDVQNAGAALGSVISVMIGFAATMYLLPPAITAIGTALATMGSMGWIAIPTLLALGGVFVAIGFGIKQASEGLSVLVSSFNNLNGSISSVAAPMVSIIAIMAGAAAMLWAMVPAITALGVAGISGAFGLLAIGAAFLGIGQGIKWASEGLSSMVTSFNEVKNSSAAMGAVIAVMAGAVGAMWLMPPAIVAIGGALGTMAALGMGAIPVILALGGAMVLAGYGIKLAGEGIANVSKSIGNLFISVFESIESSDKLEGFGLKLLSLAPALLAVGAAGLLAFPGLTSVSIGLGLLGASLALVMPSLDRLSALNLGNLENVGKSLMSLVPGLFAFSSVGLVTPLLLGATGAVYLLSAALTSLTGLDLATISSVGGALSNSTLGLIAFSSVGVFSPLLIAAAAAIGAVGMALGTFQSINIQSLSGVGDLLSSISGSLFKFSAMAVIAPLLLTASAGISALGYALQSLSPSFNELSGIDFGILNYIGESIQDSIPSLMSFGLLGVMSAPIMLGAFTLLSVGKMLSVAAAGFETFGNLNLDGFKKVTSELSSTIYGLSSLSGIVLLAAPIVAGATMLSVAGAMMMTAANGFQAMSLVNWSGLKNMGETLSSMVPGLLSFSGLGLVSGLILTTGLALQSVGKGLQSLQGIDFNSISGLGEVINSITPALSTFSLLGVLSAPIMLAAGALSLLGNSFGTISKGIGSFSSVNWSDFKTAGSELNKSIPAFMDFSLLGLLSAPIMMGAGALSALGKSLGIASSGFASISSVDWGQVKNMSGILNDVIPSFVKFGVQGLFAVPGISMMNNVLSRLSSTMLELSPALDMASQSLLSMSSSLDRAKVAMKGIDPSALNNLAEVSDKFSSSQIVTQAQPVAQAQTQQTVPIKIKTEPIVINLRLNGRDIHQEIVEANTHVS